MQHLSPAQELHRISAIERWDEKEEQYLVKLASNYVYHVETMQMINDRILSGCKIYLPAEICSLLIFSMKYKQQSVENIKNSIQSFEIFIREKHDSMLRSKILDVILLFHDLFSNNLKKVIKSCIKQMATNYRAQVEKSVVACMNTYGEDLPTFYFVMWSACVWESPPRVYYTMLIDGLRSEDATRNYRVLKYLTSCDFFRSNVRIAFPIILDFINPKSKTSTNLSSLLRAVSNLTMEPFINVIYRQHTVEIVDIRTLLENFKSEKLQQAIANHYLTQIDSIDESNIMILYTIIPYIKTPTSQLDIERLANLVMTKVSIHEEMKIVPVCCWLVSKSVDIHSSIISKLVYKKRSGMQGAHYYFEGLYYLLEEPKSRHLIVENLDDIFSTFFNDLDSLGSMLPQRTHDFVILLIMLLPHCVRDHVRDALPKIFDKATRNMLYYFVKITVIAYYPDLLEEKQQLKCIDAIATTYYFFDCLSNFYGIQALCKIAVESKSKQLLYRVRRALIYVTSLYFDRAVPMEEIRIWGDALSQLHENGYEIVDDNFKQWMSIGRFNIHNNLIQCKNFVDVTIK
jgi:hypothetical protein